MRRSGIRRPSGQQNALKHGAYTKAAEERRAEMRKLIGAASELLREIE
jgi:hypothetical protein